MSEEQTNKKNKNVAQLDTAAALNNVPKISKVDMDPEFIAKPVDNRLKDKGVTSEQLSRNDVLISYNRAAQGSDTVFYEQAAAGIIYQKDVKYPNALIGIDQVTLKHFDDRNIDPKDRKIHYGRHKKKGVYYWKYVETDDPHTVTVKQVYLTNFASKQQVEAMIDRKELKKIRDGHMFRTKRPLTYATTRLIIDEDLEVAHLYDSNYHDFNLHTRPHDYASQDEARQALRNVKTTYLAQKSAHGGKGSNSLNVADIAWIIAKTVALTVVPSGESGKFSLAVYDYDRKVYTLMTETILNDYMVLLMGVSSQSQLKSLIMTLEGRRDQLAIYHALPKYKIAVGNGIYNCLTETLEPLTPVYTILTKIDTDYDPNAKMPNYGDGFTLESMIDNLANHNPDRKKLLIEIVKAIITEHTIKSAAFFVVGRGGDGKSTFFELICNVLGRENVAYLNMSEINQPDKLLEVIGKKLILGPDNDVKTFIRSTARLKSIASHDVISLSRKYLTAISARITAIMVQLCNQFPRFAETGSSMRRRIVPFKAEHSYYEEQSENGNVDDKYIHDPAFLKYTLKYFLETETAGYYADYNDVDTGLALDSFNNEDTISQYLQDLDNIGLFSKEQKSLPTSHLYAGYVDWMHDNNPTVDPLSRRGFTAQIPEPLRNYGFELIDHNSHREQPIIKSGAYMVNAWGDLQDGENLKTAINKPNGSSQFFEHVANRLRPRQMTRDDHPVSAEEYFGILPDIFQIEEREHYYRHQIIEPGLYSYKQLGQVLGVDYTDLIHPTPLPGKTVSVALWQDAEKQEHEEFLAAMKKKGVDIDKTFRIPTLDEEQDREIEEVRQKAVEKGLGGYASVNVGSADADQKAFADAFETYKKEQERPDFDPTKKDHDRNVMSKLGTAINHLEGNAILKGFEINDINTPDDLTRVAAGFRDKKRLTDSVQLLNKLAPFIDVTDDQQHQAALTSQMFNSADLTTFAEGVLMDRKDDQSLTDTISKLMADSYNSFDINVNAVRGRLMTNFFTGSGIPVSLKAGKLTNEEISKIILKSDTDLDERQLRIKHYLEPIAVTLAKSVDNAVRMFKDGAMTIHDEDAEDQEFGRSLTAEFAGTPQFEGTTTEEAMEYMANIGRKFDALDRKYNGDKAYSNKLENLDNMPTQPAELTDKERNDIKMALEFLKDDDQIKQAHPTNDEGGDQND